MNLIKRLISLMPPFWLWGFKAAGESGGENEPEMTATFVAVARLNTNLKSEPDTI